jgi:hypothetical protein
MLVFSRRVGGKAAILGCWLLILSVWQGMDNSNRFFPPSKLNATDAQYRTFMAEESGPGIFNRHIPAVNALFSIKMGKQTSHCCINTSDIKNDSSYLAPYANRGPPCLG